MQIFLFFLLFTAIAVLSRPGLLRHNPLTGAQLGHIQSLIAQRALGIVLILPALIMQVMTFPFWGYITRSSLWAILIIGILVPFLAFLIARADKNESQRIIYAGLLDGKFRWISYVFVTCLYMTLYEILLRGILLYYLLSQFEIVAAIAINALIYAAMHLVKSTREALLGIPLGILLCWITVQTNSVWPAVVFHSAMALSFEFYYSRKTQYAA